jgi:hypothetical protein
MATTRHQAIASGLLIDVTKTAQELGINFPVTFTRLVWERCVLLNWKEEEYNNLMKVKMSRIGNILRMGQFICHGCPPGESRFFEIRQIPAKGQQVKFEVVPLMFHVGYGEANKPSIIISMANEALAKLA